MFEIEVAGRVVRQRRALGVGQFLKQASEHSQAIRHGLSAAWFARLNLTSADARLRNVPRLFEQRHESPHDHLR